MRCCHIIARSTEWVAHLLLSFQFTVFLSTKASIIFYKWHLFLLTKVYSSLPVYIGLWMNKAKKTSIYRSLWAWLNLLQEHYILITKMFWIIPGFPPHKYSLLLSGNARELKDVFRQENLNASNHWHFAKASHWRDMLEMEGAWAVGTEYSFLAVQLLGHFFLSVQMT